MLQAELYIPVEHAEAALMALQPVAGGMSGWHPAEDWVGEPERLEGLVIGTEMRLVKGAGGGCWMRSVLLSPLSCRHYAWSGTVLIGWTPVRAVD